MPKVKITRKDQEGKDQELEVEESEILDTDVRTPEPAPETKKTEPTLTQSQVNKLMADDRRKHTAEIAKLKAEFDEYRQGIEAKEQAANDAAKEKVEKLRANLPDGVIKLLDKLTPIEQLEWLSDPENVIEKSTIPPLPESRKAPGAGPKPITII